jgi:aconitate hydratase
MHNKVSVETTSILVSKVYDKLQDSISRFRRLVKRPLTISEKILVGHLSEMQFIKGEFQSGKDYILLKPDRVALQDVTGQMATLNLCKLI